MTDRRCRLAPWAVAVTLLVTLAGCATRTAPPLPTALTYPEFMYPVVPPELAAADQSGRIDRGWRYLQNADLGNAEREFAAALKGRPALYPAQTGRGFVALAGENFDQALDAFDTVLGAAPRYVPALVGRAQTLLALKRDAAALEAFEAALASDPSLADVRRRVDVLRFRGLQDLIETARGATAAGRLDEADAAYERALAASPDSAFLHRERGVVARRRGNTAAALEYFRRASELDPGDMASLVQIGELLEEQQDVAGAEAAYRRAADIEPSARLAAKLAALVERAREAELPAEFRAIASATEITRGDLAALVGVRLEGILREASSLREVVMTDIGGHWAASWITEVARAGVMDPFANHTFQPESRVTRGDLAGAISRLIALLAVNRPPLRPHLTARPAMTDMAAGHLSYQAAAVAVAAGVMPLVEDDRFEVARPVSGTDAAEVVSRLRNLASPAR